MKRVVILSNGNPPKKQVLLQHVQLADFFICADGGANIAAKYRVKPDFIIGDLDSVTEATLNKFKDVEVRRIREQNSTDLEKALSYAVSKQYDDILVLGATGGRIDHEVGNLSALAKFSRKVKIKFVDEYGELLPIIREQEFNLRPGTTLSLIPLSLCEGIVTSGLKWNLKNESLRLGFRESTSNVVVSSPIKIKIRNGDLIVFIIYDNQQATSNKK